MPPSPRIIIPTAVLVIGLATATGSPIAQGGEDCPPESQCQEQQAQPSDPPPLESPTQPEPAPAPAPPAPTPQPPAPTPQPPGAPTGPNTGSGGGGRSGTVDEALDRARRERRRQRAAKRQQELNVQRAIDQELDRRIADLSKEAERLKQPGGGDRPRVEPLAKQLPKKSDPSVTDAPDPTRALPDGGMVGGLPSPARAVPNFVIEKFRVPIFLLPIYQAAGTEYGIRWEILAAINEIETDYGRNLSVSSAGAEGWMQFMPASWRTYGIDANRDGRKDPYNPVDAIFAAARYLDAANYEKDVRGAIFAYNHADWYVDSVLMRAKMIAGVPADVTGSLTGLTEGRFPVYAKAAYAGEVSARGAERRVRGGSAADVHESDPSRRAIDIFTEAGAPVVAVTDGEIARIGESRKLGRFIVLQDAYGNQYTYSNLGSVERWYPGEQPETTPPGKDGETGQMRVRAAGKRRLFANPDRQQAQRAEAASAQGDPTRDPAAYQRFARDEFGLDVGRGKLRRLGKGSKVSGGTLLGRVAEPSRGDPYVTFSIRPAGRGAPLIDPKPILDGWKLLEQTAIYRANGRNVLRPGGSGVGAVLQMSKPQLERRVLADRRIEIYDAGRQDIQTGRIDRRVLATLAFLSESGLRPTVTSLISGHSKYTRGGSVSHHWTGNAADIAQVNGIPILGHQDRDGVAEQAVQRLMQLQGTMRPDEIISLLDFGDNTMAMADHADHIHVGFPELYGSNRGLGRATAAVLKPGQWDELIQRLDDIEQPKLRGPKPQDGSSSGRAERASRAHKGE
jgi:transglycosylase-like protein with SLT domain